MQILLYRSHVPIYSVFTRGDRYDFAHNKPICVLVQKSGLVQCTRDLEHNTVLEFWYDKRVPVPEVRMF